MTIEYKDGSTIVANNDIAHRLADAEYYLAVAMISGNRRRKKYWLKRIKELESIKGNQR